MSHDAEKEVFVGVVRANGAAMFHRQDCPHAKRAMSGQWYTAEDFAPGDVACLHCLPDVSTRPAEVDDDWDDHEADDNCQHEWEMRSEHDTWVCAWCQAETTSPDPA